MKKLKLTQLALMISMAFLFYGLSLQPMLAKSMWKVNLVELTPA
jgi:hypothetical protein